jgi:hypothetical protein
VVVIVVVVEVETVSDEFCFLHTSAKPLLEFIIPAPFYAWRCRRCSGSEINCFYLSMTHNLNRLPRLISSVSRWKTSGRLILYIAWSVVCRGSEVEEKSRCQPTNVISAHCLVKAQVTSLRRNHAPICIDSQDKEGIGEDSPHNSVKHPESNLLNC